MANNTLSFDLKTSDETAQFASLLAVNVAPGDTILLSGPVGAGKTHFARSFIKSILEVDEDVPSPTFTLVQVYETRLGELWHSDLYRLSDEFEIEELGLSDAMNDAICLIEWPDRLGGYMPSNALHLSMSPAVSLTERRLLAQWSDPKWQAKLGNWKID